MSDTLVIEKGVPPPSEKATGYGGGLFGTMKKMGVGDSVFVPIGFTPSNPYSVATQLGFKVTVRTVDGGRRIWRIA